MRPALRWCWQLAQGASAAVAKILAKPTWFGEKARRLVVFDGAEEEMDVEGAVVGESEVSHG